MLSLLLRLSSTSRRAGDIHAILRHDGETGQSDLGGLLGVFLWLLLRYPRALAWSWSADRSISGVTKCGRGGRRWGEDGWAETGGLRDGALLEGLPWRGESDIICANESAGREVDGGGVKEIEGYFGELVLLGHGTSDKVVDQMLQLLGPESRVELEGSSRE